jgi:hypothetical protein
MLTEKELKCERPRDFGTDEQSNFPSKPDSHEEKPIFVTSMFFQEYEGLSNPKPEHPVQVRVGSSSMFAIVVVQAASHIPLNFCSVARLW